MDIPKEFEQALQRKESIALEAQTGTTPRLASEDGTTTWGLNGFSARAAFLFADNLLEQYGYMLAPDTQHASKPTHRTADIIAHWSASDP